MNVRFLTDAIEDARLAGDRLDREEPGFGERFAAELRKGVERIHTSPRLCPKTEDGPDEPENREYFMRLFNYRVIFAIWKDEAVIVAVIHAARPPAMWVPRLAQIDDN